MAYSLCPAGGSWAHNCFVIPWRKGGEYLASALSGIDNANQTSPYLSWGKRVASLALGILLRIPFIGAIAMRCFGLTASKPVSLEQKHQLSPQPEPVQQEPVVVPSSSSASPLAQESTVSPQPEPATVQTKSVYEPIVSSHEVQIGKTTIPLGNALTLQNIFCWDSLFADKKGRVRVAMNGGMGFSKKMDVHIDFLLHTRERAIRVARDFLRKGASFSLSASSIKPCLEANNNRVNGIVEIEFDSKPKCEEFSSIAAEVFFPDFQGTPSGKVLKLISKKEGTEKEIVQMTNASLQRLNAQTFKEVGVLLLQQQDQRFYAEAAKSSSEGHCTNQDRDNFSRHYLVALDGTVQKEMLHFGSPPQDQDKISRVTGNRQWYGFEPLEAWSKEEQAEYEQEALSILKMLEIIVEKSPYFNQKLAPVIDFYKTELKKRFTNRDLADIEVSRNFVREKIGALEDYIPEEDHKAFLEIAEQCKEQIQKLIPPLAQ